MKSLRSSLLQKLILGYKISKSGGYLKFGPQLQSLSKFRESIPQPKPLDVKQLAETFKFPVQAIEKIYNKSKEIEANLPKEPIKEFDASILKNKIEELEKTAIGSGAYILPEIINLIDYTKQKVHDLELASAPEFDPIEETKNQIKELEREKKALEEAKQVIMEKYYNREIDESSIKSIMDNYEQRLVESGIKIKNLNQELSELGKGAKPGYLKRKQEGMLSGQSPTLSKLFKFPTSESGLSVTRQPINQVEIVKRISTEPQGFEIPQISKKGVKLESLEGEEIPNISLVYPLIPRSPVKGEPIFAYAKIFLDETSNRYTYNLVEPKLTEKLKEVYRKVKEMLEQRLDIDFSKLKKIEAKEFLDRQVDEVLKYFNFVLTENEKRILKYYMNRDFTGLEMIEALMQDPNLEDISCDGIRIPLFIFHRNPDIGSIVTNVIFDSTEQLDSFIIRLAQLCGKSISVSQPLLDGTLPDGSRIQATLGTDIARKGSNFTIRKFTEEPLTPVHLINYGTLNVNLLAFLWFVVDYGRSILVSGGTASGKTSLLNVLSLFIRPEKKIVSIEDTAELRLPHPHWVPAVARVPIGEEGKNEVDMFDLLRESLRQRPDYIVVGEVRGKEAFVLFQQMATGHPSLATIHAENIARLADRLTTPPISLSVGLISSLDIVIFLARMKYKNKFVRKVTEIVELEGFDQDGKKPITNQIYKWNPQTDKFEITNKSISLKKISDLTGISEKDIKSEIQRRILIIEWMKENSILDYHDVHRIFSLYYADPERLLSSIQGAG